MEVVTLLSRTGSTVGSVTTAVVPDLIGQISDQLRSNATGLSISQAVPLTQTATPAWQSGCGSWGQIPLDDWIPTTPESKTWHPITPTNSWDFADGSWSTGPSTEPKTTSPPLSMVDESVVGELPHIEGALRLIDPASLVRLVHWTIPQILLRSTVHWSYERSGEHLALLGDETQDETHPPGYKGSGVASYVCTSKWNTAGWLKAVPITWGVTFLIYTRGRAAPLTASVLAPTLWTTLLVMVDNRATERVFDSPDRTTTGEMVGFGGAIAWLLLRFATCFTVFRNLA